MIKVGLSYQKVASLLLSENSESDSAHQKDMQRSVQNGKEMSKSPYVHGFTWEKLIYVFVHTIYYWCIYYSK